MSSKILYIFLLLATFLGIFCGVLFPEQMLNLKWIDVLYINILKLIATPLIFAAVVTAITSMGNIKRLNTIWLYTIGYTVFSATMAVLIGILLLNIFKPGNNMPASLIGLHTVVSQLETLNSTSSFFNALLPSSRINSAADFELLPIIIFSLVFAIACVSVGKTSNPLIAIILAIRNVFSKIIIWLMYLTPVVLFILWGSAIAEAYTRDILLASVQGLLLFILIFLLGLFLQCFWQCLLVKFLVKRSPKELLNNAINPLLMAFTSSSSLLSLPMTMASAKIEKIDKEIAEFVLPFSSTLNLSGILMYEAVSVLFFCQILGMKLSILSQIEVCFTSIVAGIGVGAIPEGGLITMIIILKSVNIPISAITLLVPFDHILDRIRTMVNVWSDLVCAMTVNHLMLKKVSKD